MTLYQIVSTPLRRHMSPSCALPSLFTDSSTLIPWMHSCAGWCLQVDTWSPALPRCLIFPTTCTRSMTDGIRPSNARCKTHGNNASLYQEKKGCFFQSWYCKRVQRERGYPSKQHRAKIYIGGEKREWCWNNEMETDGEWKRDRST